MSILTEDEKRAVAVQLHSKPSWKGDLAQYGIWLLPVIAFATYGIIQKEIVAVTLAFLVLLAMGIWFLVYSHKHAIHLHSAVTKYESQVRALRDYDNHE